MSANPSLPRSRSRPTINLSDLAVNPDQLAKLELSRPESQDERAARLHLQNLKARTQLIKEIVIFAAGVIGVIIVAWICVAIIREPSTSPDDKKWAQTVLAGIVTSIIGYLIGKSQAGET